MTVANDVANQKLANYLRVTALVRFINEAQSPGAIKNLLDDDLAITSSMALDLWQHKTNSIYYGFIVDFMRSEQEIKR